MLRERQNDARHRFCRVDHAGKEAPEVLGLLARRIIHEFSSFEIPCAYWYCPVTCEPRCEHSFTLVEAVQLCRLLERQQAGQEEADEQAGAGHWEQRQR